MKNVLLKVRIIQGPGTGKAAAELFSTPQELITEKQVSDWINCRRLPSHAMQERVAKLLGESKFLLFPKGVRS
jgi:hypothetical protein